MISKSNMPFTLHIVFLALSISFILIGSMVDSSFLILGWPLLLSIVFLLISIYFAGYNILVIFSKTSNFPLRSYDRYREYYDKLGFSLFTGGIIAVLTTSYLFNAIGLIVLGILSILFSVYCRNKVEKFNSII